jgi:hypothetical protein
MMMIQQVLVGISVMLAIYVLAKPLITKPKKGAKCISNGKGCGC